MSNDTKMQKVELLAPAGTMDCFEAALCAGADAVYLGGSKFGARAYAGNFSEEELIRALDMAHLFDKKIYLTLNTLIKEKEFSQLYAYLLPYYEEGLDGIIVQDYGVARFVRREFPELPLHISTQQTVTGVHGLEFAKMLGAERVVPARECSLDEIRKMHKAEPDMELECFIHGAMCYCYSGQCLFSSLVGGRSGNRGTCAQPCRLSYHVNVSRERYKDIYPLSLKDLCTIELVPELIEVGISSFKIEGRMKSPEYVAGVTGIYRNVIDRYYETGSAHLVQPKEKEILSKLYIRSETAQGYYHKQNGKDMVTLKKPAYNGNDEETLAYIRSRFMKDKMQIQAKASAVFRTDAPAMLTVCYGDTEVEVAGEICHKAQNRPLDRQELMQRLNKTGDSLVTFSKMQLLLDDNVFMPVGQINALRRDAIQKLEEALLATKRRVIRKEDSADITATKQPSFAPDVEDRTKPYIAVSVTTRAQLDASLQHTFVNRIYVPWNLFTDIQAAAYDEKEVYFAFPRVIRNINLKKVEDAFAKALKLNALKGVYIHTADACMLAYAMIHAAGRKDVQLQLSPFMYAMNSESVQMLMRISPHISIPYELNERELFELLEADRYADVSYEMPVYGKIPLMVSANCIRKTCHSGGCMHETGFEQLTDRVGNKMSVLCSCENCYNEIYNSVPMVLLKQMQKLRDKHMVQGFLLAFTDERKEETVSVLDAYKDEDARIYEAPYTNGHWKRGVL